jgi:thymidylate synthase ThyX
MRIELAGYNIDSHVLREAAEAGVPREHLTPEVISAAYARISRDPRPVGELRAAAVDEVGKARNSNRKIIFEMGHHSVAEHALFNFDVVGISRLAIEWLESFRLCSYTEKSQRYITLDHDFTIPAELADTPYESTLMELITQQSQLYGKFNQKLRARLSKMHQGLETKKSGRRLLDGWAKEDARYVTLLATTGQLGLSANARNLELIIRRFAAAPLEEVREIGRRLYTVTAEVAPSLLLFTEVSSFDRDTASEIRELTSRHTTSRAMKRPDSSSVRLVRHTAEPDRIVAAAMLYSASNESYEQCRKVAFELSEQDLVELFHTALSRMEFYDAPSRAFEHVDLTFDIVISASAYAQLKRHRMTTQSLQEYDPGLGLTVPPAIEELDLADQFCAHAEQAGKLFRQVQSQMPDVAPYVLTNAHRRRVLIKTNLRELYHLIRLREDTHAQWDIYDFASQMRRLTEEVMPLGAMLLCGKDGYVERYKKVFSRPPTIIPPD